MNGNVRSILFGFLALAMTLVTSCGDNPVDPAGFSGRTGGCGNFFVYRFNAGMEDAVVVSVTSSQLTLDQTPREFTLPHSSVEASIDRFTGSADAYYCDDVSDDSEPRRKSSWKAVSGTVSMAIVDSLGSAQAGWTTYKVAVVLRDATFRDDDGKDVHISEVDFGEIMVGWFPG